MDQQIWTVSSGEFGVEKTYAVFNSKLEAFKCFKELASDEHGLESLTTILWSQDTPNGLEWLELLPLGIRHYSIR